MNQKKSIAVVFKSDGMGVTAEQPLREMLARKFLALVVDADPLPEAICFYTDGVKLICEGSPILAELLALEAQLLEAFAAGSADAAPRRGAVWYATAVTPLLDAWWNDGGAPQVVGLVTDGSVPGIPAGVVVERATDIARGTFSPRQFTYRVNDG